MEKSMWELQKPHIEIFMLDKQVLKIYERPTRHRLFLSQEVVSHEVWTNGLQRKHNYIQQSPWR
jgi:hypothetical protein